MTHDRVRALSEQDEGKCPCGFVPRHVAPDGCASWSMVTECPCGKLIDLGEKCETCGTKITFRGGKS